MLEPIELPEVVSTGLFIRKLSAKNELLRTDYIFKKRDEETNADYLILRASKKFFRPMKRISPYTLSVNFVCDSINLQKHKDYFLCLFNAKIKEEPIVAFGLLNVENLIKFLNNIYQPIPELINEECIDKMPDILKKFYDKYEFEKRANLLTFNSENKLNYNPFHYDILFEKPLFTIEDIRENIEYYDYVSNVLKEITKIQILETSLTDTSILYNEKNELITDIRIVVDTHDFQ